jgi:regulator of PEP synthase PpsR (kinase-PPPase family)
MAVTFKQAIDTPNEDAAVAYVISDSLGGTASGVVSAAAAQFERGSVEVIRLTKVESVDDVRAYLDAHFDPERPCAVFHTIADPELRQQIKEELEGRMIPSIDLIGPSISILSVLTGSAPSRAAGQTHVADDRYFRRISAMEFFVDHDDGRNPEGLKDAEIVLVGVSRTSKTPLSMYLAFLGYDVANVPLAHGMEPPSQLLEEVDSGRIFGLLSTVDVLSEIRDSRLSDDATYAAAGSYADPAQISDEQREARVYMKKLGCLVIHTEHKSVEETASEIVEHIEALERARGERN